MVNLKDRSAVIAVAILISCHKITDQLKETFSSSSQRENKGQGAVLAQEIKVQTDQTYLLKHFSEKRRIHQACVVLV